MSKQDSKNQQKFMSFMFRGKEILKPLNTGYIDKRISCIRKYLKLLKQIEMVYLKNQKYTQEESKMNIQKGVSNVRFIGDYIPYLKYKQKTKKI